MKRDPYLGKYVSLLEQSNARALKDLERERKRVDFLEGKCDRLELVVLSMKGEAGRDYAERSDRAAEPPAPRKPPIEKVPAAVPTRMPFSQIREQWNNLTPEQQEEALQKGNIEEAKPKEATP